MGIEENKKALVDELLKQNAITGAQAENYVNKIYGKCVTCKFNEKVCTNLKSKFLNLQITMYNSCEEYKCYVELETINIEFSFSEKEQFKKNDKLDSKPMMHLIDAHFKMELASLLTLGGYKYDFENWRLATKEDVSRYRDALERHLLARDLGEYIDLDTGLPHTICVAFNAMALHYLDLKLGNDDGKRELFNKQLTKYKNLKEKQNAK